MVSEKLAELWVCTRVGWGGAGRDADRFVDYSEMKDAETPQIYSDWINLDLFSLGNHIVNRSRLIPVTVYIMRYGDMRSGGKRSIQIVLKLFLFGK